MRAARTPRAAVPVLAVEERPKEAENQRNADIIACLGEEWSFAAQIARGVRTWYLSWNKVG